MSSGINPTDGSSNNESKTHLKYIQLALDEARKSPPKPTNFCVGACLVANDEVLVTGYTLECEGNTHAEQCCFIKLASKNNCSESDLGLHLLKHTSLYTTMEPCNKRSVSNTPCVDRILALHEANGKAAIEKVFVGVLEPDTFVGVNEGKKRLQDAGIEVIKIGGLETEILEVAKAGHEGE